MLSGIGWKQRHHDNCLKFVQQVGLDVQKIGYDFPALGIFVVVNRELFHLEISKSVAVYAMLFDMIVISHNGFMVFRDPGLSLLGFK